MTTAEIEALIDPGALAAADLNTKTDLRYIVIPEFLEAVGYVSWRRKNTTATLAAATNYFDVPSVNTTFSHMKEIYIAPGLSKEDKLVYIGDEPDLVATGLANTITGKPTGYWLDFDGNAFTRVYFNATADQQYTVYYTYDFDIKFNDGTSSVQLNPYIPQKFQPALIFGGQRELHRRRFGVGSNEFQAAAGEFERWKMIAKKSPDLAQLRRYKYAR